MQESQGALMIFLRVPRSNPTIHHTPLSRPSPEARGDRSSTLESAGLISPHIPQPLCIWGNNPTVQSELLTIERLPVGSKVKLR